jgi:hypothetical protein
LSSRAELVLAGLKRRNVTARCKSRGDLILLLAVVALSACGPARAPAGGAGSGPGTSAPPPVDDAAYDFRARDALRRTLRDFADALEARSPRRTLELLAADFDDLARFEDSLTEFLRQAAELRVMLRASSTEVNGNRAVMIVDAEMIYSRRSAPGADRRRRERLQIDFVLTERGWEIFQLTPRDFFMP